MKFGTPFILFFVLVSTSVLPVMADIHSAILFAQVNEVGSVSTSPQTDINTEQYYAQARELSLSGNYVQALERYRVILEIQPENPDYLLGMGQTLLWSGRGSEAIPYLERAIDISPEYEDLYLVLYQCYQTENRVADAEKIRQLAVVKFNQPEWTAGTVKNRATRYNIALENQMEYPGGNLSDWRSTSLSFYMDFEDRRQVGARVQSVEKFRLDDSMIGIFGTLPLENRFTLSAHLDVSPSHKVLPETSAYLNLGYAMTQGWGVLLGFRHTDYNESNVHIGDVTIERYISNYRFAYTYIYSDSNVAGNASNHRLQFGYFFASGSNIQLALSTGTEVEKPNDATTVLSINQDTISLWGETRVSDHWGILYSVGYRDLKLYNRPISNREFFSLGIKFSF